MCRVEVLILPVTPSAPSGFDLQNLNQSTMAKTDAGEQELLTKHKPMVAQFLNQNYVRVRQIVSFISPLEPTNSNHHSSS